MDKAAFFEELLSVFRENGMDDLLAEDGERNADRFYELTQHLLAENARYNLTAITEPHDMILRHYADSAASARYLPIGATLLDVGCGAGFPSLPLAILRPDLTVTALDATAKRVEFVRAAAERLSLSNIRTVCARAEEYARGEGREAFAAVTARAVANLRTLSELCLPCVEVGGLFLAMKAKSAAEELSEAAHAISMLGGKCEREESLTLTNGEEELSRTALLIRKLRKTPPEYPRAYARILKKPL